MKTNNIKSLLLAGIVSCGLATGLTSCKSGDQDFPDFDYQTCYFAKQYPVRTVELGNDLYVDLTGDNQHKIQIQATMGGAYSNPRDITIDFAVEPKLCEGLTFEDGTAVTLMPENYYHILGNNIVIPSGQPVGGVEVQLEDAFFNDPLSVTNHYVIPVRMLKATGVDHILEGKDFVLYAVKYVNKYHGNYIKNGNLHAATADVTTKGLKTSIMVYDSKDSEGVSFPCELQLNFDDNDACTVTALTEGYTVTGSGRFVENDQTQLVGARHPNTIYLKFSGTFEGFKYQKNAKGEIVEDGDGNPIKIPVKFDFSEDYVLTLKTRGVKSENFK